MIEAHVFQHKFGGSQMFVYHVENEVQARNKFSETVIDIKDWYYLGTKWVI